MERIQPKGSPPFLASKWFHIQLLVDVEELTSLLVAWEEVLLFSTMGVHLLGEGEILREALLEAWSSYIFALKKGEVIQEQKLRPYVTLAITKKDDAVVSLDIGEGKEIITAIKPIIQMQMHRFDYSLFDGKFRPMVLGKDTISWGIQLSYPQLFQDPETREVHNTLVSGLYDNTALFRVLQQWTRKYTVPTPFIVQGKKIYAPLRLGKRCFSWVNMHQELLMRGLVVGEASYED